jgi:hypothetical protein
LQNDNGRLQKANQQLSQQLDATSASAQQQQEQLQQIAAENQARAAQQSDADAERNQCINNLRQIDAAKNQWALELNKPNGAVPTEQDISPYIKLDANGNIPKCPSGGIYTIGAIGEAPSCSVHGTFAP